MLLGFVLFNVFPQPPAPVHLTDLSRTGNVLHRPAIKTCAAIEALGFHASQAKRTMTKREKEREKGKEGEERQKKSKITFDHLASLVLIA